MSAEYPDHTWSEERIAALLQSSVGKGDVVASGQRLKCLELLSERKRLVNKQAIFPSLVEISKTHGNSEPEASLLIGILGKFVEGDGEWVNSLLETLDKKYEPLVLVVTQVLRYIRKPHERRRVIDRLLSLLFTWGTLVGATDGLCETITGYSDRGSKAYTMKEISQYLEHPNPFEAFYAMRIASRLGARRITLTLCEMAEKSVRGWYDSHASRIQEEFYDFVRRVRDPRAKPTLLKLLKESQSFEAAKALATIADRSTVNDVFVILVDSFTKDYQCVQRCFSFLDMVNPVLIDPAKFLSVRNQVGLGLRNSLIRIVERLGQRAKPHLAKLLKSDDETDYTLALECLTGIGTTVEEMSKVFECNPRNAVYDFFYRKRKLTLDELWEEKEKLGDTIKTAHITKLDHFVLTVLNTFGFVSFCVDSAGVPGIDIVSFSPQSPHLLLVGCTTGILKEDLQQLQASMSKLRRDLPDIAKKLNILPVMVTSKDVALHSTDVEYAARNNMAVLVQQDVEKLMTMLKTQRTAADVIRLLTTTRDKIKTSSLSLKS